MSIYNEVFDIQARIERLLYIKGKIITGEFLTDAEKEQEEFTRDEYLLTLEKIKEEITSHGLERLCKVKKNFENSIEGLKAEEKRLHDKRERLEKQTEHLDRYILDILFLTWEKKQEAGTFTVTYREAESVRVDERIFNSPDYMITQTTARPDKTKIKTAIKNGLEIKGAHIEVNKHLQVK